jgi:AcrR family transcriptional regulator
MPKVLPQYLELRRQQIVEAAAVCFSRRGFHQTTMQDICDEAELSPGAVYRYFRSKEEIIEGMGEYRQRDNADRLAQAMAKGSTIDTFDELLKVFFINRDKAEFDEYCALTIEFMSEAPRSERIRQSLSQTSKAVREGLEKLIEESQKRGEVNSTLEPEAVARTMIALYQGFLTQRIVDPDLDVYAYTQAAGSLYGGTFWTGNGSDGARAPLEH